MWAWILLAVLPSTRVYAEYWLSVPRIPVVYYGDIEVHYGGPPSSPDLALHLLEMGKDGEKTISKRDLPKEINKGKITLPCGTFERAGQFLFKLVTATKDKELARTEPLDVRWPEMTVHVPLMVETYSSDVMVQLYVQNLRCKPRASYSTLVDLIYEGAALSSWLQPTILTTETLTGWLWQSSFDVNLNCTYFDRAGNYTVRVRTNLTGAPEIATSDTILVMWSRHYSVSVAKSSVQPCDGSLSVIYHYPRCILGRDRIRVYGKALKGPLKYIVESRVENGKYLTKLSCDIFQDEYQEYCFSFVTTARNGAVFDLKTLCLPTLTDSKGFIATWNDWGPWSECSITCGSGVQNRYRLCVSPTNSSDCVGKAVQSRACKQQKCQDEIQTTTEEPQLWDCSCGCEKNLTDRLLAKLSILDCETGANWIVQAWPSGYFIVEIRSISFPSSDYWLTIRDGKSQLGAVLAIAGAFTPSRQIHSLSDTIRMEVHAINSTSIENTRIVLSITRSESPRESLAMIRQKVDDDRATSNFSAVHVIILMLATILCSTTAMLVLFHFCRQARMMHATSETLGCPELLTSTSELSIKSPSASPEDYLYNSFIFRSSTSLQPKIKWDKPSIKPEPPSTSTPVRRRGRPTIKNIQRESATPLTASVSELSTTGSEDGLEYDYYDYGCHQEPGSFFCPDPVLMGWPPFIPLPPQGMEEFGDYPLQHFTPSPDPS